MHCAKAIKIKRCFFHNSSSRRWWMSVCVWCGVQCAVCWVVFLTGSFFSWSRTVESFFLFSVCFLLLLLDVGPTAELMLYAHANILLSDGRNLSSKLTPCMHIVHTRNQKSGFLLFWFLLSLSFSLFVEIAAPQRVGDDNDGGKIIRTHKKSEITFKLP